jgi:hypothetical protein
MQALYNHGGELIAYQYQNMLIHPDNWQVLGLVLGNCVFNQSAKVLGKFVQQNVYNLNGEVLASKAAISLPLPNELNTKNCFAQAWKILVMIKDHSCPWVNAKSKWSPASLAEAIYV